MSFFGVSVVGICCADASGADSREARATFRTTRSFQRFMPFPFRVFGSDNYRTCLTLPGKSDSPPVEIAKKPPAEPGGSEISSA